MSTRRVRRLSLVLLSAGIAALASTSCGSTIGAGPGIADTCLPGTWLSQGSSQLVSDYGNPLRGGAGEVLTISVEGSFSDDLTGTTPYQRPAQVGFINEIQLSGKLSYTANAAAGTLTLSNGTGSLTVSLGGYQPHSFPATRSETFSYTCTASSLSLHSAVADEGEDTVMASIDMNGGGVSADTFEYVKG
jgi:hypothetical protein